LITTEKATPRLQKCSSLSYELPSSVVPFHNFDHAGNCPESTSGESHKAIMTNVIFCNFPAKADQKSSFLNRKRLICILDKRAMAPRGNLVFPFAGFAPLI
jgi:hypothetical protein